ncbi:hypothetical protein [Xylophilus ampelinus]|uniref:Uncharacterized protein n=1 Tax=Xylophilus ampelinus TaxID=54067 RepID=A0A318SKS3_9BURK|nr:hypothetical protein [Xylophilus ampelinus]MCS4508920.1 hypothetical protein [Xylophilus ampelinus]PYE79486.1 hypothetical protein DFQ15_102219 [Xylophilus ampelinus]
MNRAQRRAAGHRRAPNRNQLRADPTAAFAAIGACLEIEPASADHLLIVARSAFRDMAAGSTDPQLFDALGMQPNVGLIRAESIAPELVQLLMAAADAMREADDIYGRHNRYGFTGPGLQAMATGLDAYEAILRASTPAQMRTATKEMIRRMQQQLAAAAKGAATA